ncbi:MAG: lysoplasmalogenase [Clostridia bacterium]|nr:lysoplasmalogenase [Clostridia bacterium]
MIFTVLKYVFIALFAAFSAVHLYHSWKDDAPKRAKTKPFLLIFLLLFYLAASLSARTAVSWVLAGALLMSWLGDVLLIPKGNKWFVFGGIAFLASHILFVLAYVPSVDFRAVIWYIWAPALVVYYGISVAVTLSLRKTTPKPMLVPMVLYLFANSTMNLFALARLMTLKTPGSAIAYAGAILFFISDCTLYLVRYHKNRELIFKKHFTVMLTYLLGEALITVGILLA